jgi:cob(I)alamin adenosyltransferase
MAMRIYTRTGDDGTTGLFGGERVSKSDPRLECLGTLDELSAHLGSARVLATGLLSSQIGVVQSDLLHLGANLAADVRSHDRLPEGGGGAATGRLEDEIDTADGQLPKLKEFILPGGCELAARLHLARSVCRRAERRVVALQSAEYQCIPGQRYLNRLSDWLFVMARLANQQAGCPEIHWPK